MPMRPSIRLTSVDVPPMSNVISRSYPAISPTARAPTTPAAGPDRIVRTASCRAVVAAIVPPFDCMMLRRVPASSASSVVRYLAISGVTYALTTVVLQRSNSRYSRSTWCETETVKPAAASTSAARCSCDGFRYECRKQTATASTPAARKSAMARSTASASIGVSTVPSAAMRSLTPRVSAGSTSGTRGRTIRL